MYSFACNYAIFCHILSSLLDIFESFFLYNKCFGKEYFHITFFQTQPRPGLLSKQCYQVSQQFLWIGCIWTRSGATSGRVCYQQGLPAYFERRLIFWSVYVTFLFTSHGVHHSISEYRLRCLNWWLIDAPSCGLLHISSGRPVWCILYRVSKDCHGWG